jgi:hypothetical protein
VLNINKVRFVKGEGDEVATQATELTFPSEVENKESEDCDYLMDKIICLKKHNCPENLYRKCKKAIYKAYYKQHGEFYSKDKLKQKKALRQ